MAITIIPAIDIRGGRAVRLARGDFSKETKYFDDPVSAAQRWIDEGAQRIHIVDLDAAAEGRPMNADHIKKIASLSPVPIEVGGGIRSLDIIEHYLDAGVGWVIVGTAAVEDRPFVHAAAEKFPGKIILGIDAEGGFVKTRGWLEKSNVSAVDLVQSYRSVDLGAVIYTDIARDGIGTGVDVDGARKLARQAGVGVIASGGVKDARDILRVMKAEKDGVFGVIVGRALYEGTLTLCDAISMAEKKRR